MEHIQLFFNGVLYGLERIAWFTGAGLIFGCYLILSLVVVGKTLNWLIETLGDEA